MEIRHLRYFVTVAQTKHFGQAAERLHMAQSPLSQAIRQLETQLGAALFIRTTRRVDLTSAGEAFLTDAQRILHAIDEAQARARHIGAGGAGLLRVGSTGLAAFRYLPQIARVAAREMPGLVLHFVPGLLTAAQEIALEEDRIDIGVLRPPLRRNALVTRLIASERLVLALPQRHRLADGAPVVLGELRHESFIVYGTQESVVTTALTQACLAAGFVPRRAHEVADTSIMLTLVAAGLGVALLPESVMALSVEGVRYVPVADNARVDLALAWRADNTSSALLSLIETLSAEGVIPRDLSPLPTHDVLRGERC